MVGYDLEKAGSGEIAKLRKEVERDYLGQSHLGRAM
jgi:hypothetical protein